MSDKKDLLEKNRMRGEGGAPTRATTLPKDPKERKNYPIVSGVLDYFPDAIVAIARVSKAGNDQHHPGKPLFWDRSKSGDESDAFMRHFSQRGTIDEDGIRHSAKAAWRILALLQKEIEQEQDKSLTNQEGSVTVMESGVPLDLVLKQFNKCGTCSNGCLCETCEEFRKLGK